MKLNKNGAELLHHFEGCRLTAYQCPAKVWTVGYGNTRYENGNPVKQGDQITQQRADELFLNIVNKFAMGVEKLLTKKVSENQFSALVSFAYNVGLGNLQKSTLLKMVNENPNDEGINEQFLRWNKAGGKELAGLTRRRRAEADLYFS